MKKQTKQILISLFILAVLTLSSIAFVYSGVFGDRSTDQPAKQLTSFVIDGTLDPATENDYLQKGYTFLRVYYQKNTTFIASLSDYPERFATTTGLQQLIVEKVSNPTIDRIEIRNYNTNLVVNSTNETAVINALCNSFYSPSLECALLNQNKLFGTPKNNQSANETI